MNTPDNSAATFQTTPPFGFTPAKDDDGTSLGFWDGPDVERPGYKIQPTWSPENGLSLFIDHERHDAFTLAEARDLVSTLAGILEQHS